MGEMRERRLLRLRPLTPKFHMTTKIDEKKRHSPSKLFDIKVAPVNLIEVLIYQWPLQTILFQTRPMLLNLS